MSRAAVVGVFSLIALAVAAWFVLRIQGVRLGKRPGISYTVVMENAEGLQEKSWVLFKGIRVARVRELVLRDEDVLAHVEMQERIPLREGAFARVVNMGLLGEKQLELVQGRDGAPLLPDGATIPSREAASIDRILGIASDVSEDVQDVTETVQEAIGGSGEAGEDAPRLAALLEELRLTVQGLRRTSDAVTDLTRSMAKLTEGQTPAIETAAQNAAETSETVLDTAEKLEAFTDRVAGPESAAQVEGTLSAVKGGAETISRLGGAAGGLRLSLGVRGDYLAASERGKGYVSLTLLPEARWFVHGEAVSAPVEPTGDRLSWTAVAGYRWEHFRLRLGFIESRPGLGGDLAFFEDRLRLSADLWDLSRSELLPHARLQATFFPARPFFLVGGWDDALNVGRVDSAFLGGGVEIGP